MCKPLPQPRVSAHLSNRLLFLHTPIFKMSLPDPGPPCLPRHSSSSRLQFYPPPGNSPQQRLQQVSSVSNPRLPPPQQQQAPSLTNAMPPPSQQQGSILPNAGPALPQQKQVNQLPHWAAQGLPIDMNFLGLPHHDAAQAPAEPAHPPQLFALQTTANHIQH